MINKKGLILDSQRKVQALEKAEKTVEKALDEMADEITEPTEKQIEVVNKTNTQLDEARQLKEVINTFVLGHQLNSKLKKEQIDMCIQTALSFGLNPLKREIHFVPRKDWKTGEYDVNIIVGYEVYLKRAEATKRLDGWSVVIQGTNADMKAVITIHKKGWANPFMHEVYMNEARQEKSPVWDKMPRFQLKKVAISQGFRLAFPEELGGMPYIPEEIGIGEMQNGQLIEHKQPEKRVIEKPKPRLISPQKAKFIADLFVIKGKSQAPVLEFFKVSSLEDLNEDQAGATVKRLNTFPDADQSLIPDIQEPEVDPDEADAGIQKMREEEAKK